jgi:hypothetical protein
MHRYMISGRSLVYQIKLPDHMLQKKTMEELQDLLTPVVDRVLLGAAPRRVFVGSWFSR